MRKFSSYLIYFFLITLFSTSVYAAKNEICDPLKADGVTKGLYGLCIAYHASGANSQVILDNYNKKKSDSDPVMPGADVNPPSLSCACWNTLTIEDIGTTPELVPDACSLTFGDDASLEGGLLQYTSEGGLIEFLYAGAGVCFYANTATGVFGENFGLSPEAEADCLFEIYGFASGDFEKFGCIPPVP